MLTAPAPQFPAQRPGRTVPEKMVGLARVELATSSLSGMRSNQLSYKPTDPPQREALRLHSSEERLAVHRNLETHGQAYV